MSKIRKLYYFDKKSTEEMISFLNNGAEDNYINHIMFNPLIPLHHVLPLKYKFLPESYVLKDNGEIKGLITIAPIKSVPPKVEIQKLLFEEDSLSDASELVQFAVSKYKAMGAASVIVRVDDYLPDLLNMFISKCGFTQISSEKLWRVNKFSESKYNKKEFRLLRNSDAEQVTSLYNDSLLPHFRPFLSKENYEFREDIFKGLSYFSEYKYVIEDKNSKKISGVVIIRTSDNENYIADILQTGWSELNTDAILHFISDKIRKRKKRFGLFVKSKLYTAVGQKYEEEFAKNGYECVQSQILLTNSSARVLKETENVRKYTVLNNFLPSRGITT